MTTVRTHPLDFAPSAPVTVLRPSTSALPIGLGDLWRYRDLLWFLSLRDVQVRYKQTLLGAAWAILRPLVSMVIFTLLIGKVLGVSKMDDPVFVFAGVVPWTFFAAVVTAASGSLVSNAALVQKVYFPRLIIPVSSTGAPLVDYAMALVVMVGLMLCMGVGFSAQFLLIVPLLLTTVIAALGIGVGLAALSVFYRDVRHVVPFLVQMMFFLTPVLYPQTIIPEQWRWVYLLNPMAGPIEGFRAAVLGTPVDYLGWACSTAVATLMLAIGLVGFGRAERRFADVV